MKNLQKYEVKYAINHIKEYQHQNQHNFSVYNKIWKIFFDVFEHIIISTCFPQKQHVLEALVVYFG